MPIVASSAPVDGFRLAYDRVGSGPAVVLLHGWPGSRRDYEDLVPLLTGAFDDQPAAYSADGQAASVLGLIDELGLDRPILVGYDVGSRVAQTIARQRPDAIRGLVLSPLLPGVGDRAS